MKKLLHIIATPRGEDSRTLRVTGAFLDAFGRTHADWVVEELDLTREVLPPLTARRVDGKYVLLEGRDLHGALRESWEEILGHIDRFLSADGYLVSTPMWNWNIPYVFKHYIDIIMQPRLLFEYTEDGGFDGFAKGRKAVVITSRGGDYTPPGKRTIDFQEPYLRHVFGVAGVSDLAFVIAQPMDMGEDLQRQRIEEAKQAARQAAERF